MAATRSDAATEKRSVGGELLQPAAPTPASPPAKKPSPLDEGALVPTNPSRWLMYLLISLHGMPNWMIRGGIFSWVPFVVRELGLSDAQRAMLMGAWFPGCESNQAHPCLPASPLHLNTWYGGRANRVFFNSCRFGAILQMRLLRFQQQH